MRVVREMEEINLAACASILESAYGLPPYDEIFSAGVALEYVRNKYVYCAGHSFVAEDDGGRIVGFILISLSSWAEGGQAVIEEIVVAPAQQGKGYGKALMAAADKHFQSRGVHSVILWSRRDAPAHGFHESNGFEDSDEWVIMHKKS